MKTTVQSSIHSIDAPTMREALYTLAAKRLTQAAAYLEHNPSERQPEARNAIREALHLIDQAEATRQETKGSAIVHRMRRTMRQAAPTPNDIFLIDSHGRQLKVGDQIGDRDGPRYQIDDIAPEENTVGVFDVASNGPVKGVRPEAIGCKWQCRGA